MSTVGSGVGVGWTWRADGGPGDRDLVRDVLNHTADCVCVHCVDVYLRRFYLHGCRRRM